MNTTKTPKTTERQRRLFWRVSLPWGGKALFRAENPALELAQKLSAALKDGYVVKVYAPGVEEPVHQFYGHA